MQLGYTLGKQRRERGKHTPKAKEAVYLRFLPNMSVCLFWILKDKENMVSNRVKFDEHEFPYRKRNAVEQHLSDNSTDILFQQASDVM